MYIAFKRYRLSVHRTVRLVLHLTAHSTSVGCCIRVYCI
nr:MAG TPA: UPA domain protein [Caudoviricetes sp.]